MLSHSKINKFDNFIKCIKNVFCGLFKVRLSKCGYIKYNRCQKQ